MYKINAGIKFNDGIQIEFEDIVDFDKYNRERKDLNHKVRGYVKSVRCEVLYIDEYNCGMFEWYVLNGKFLNQLEPIRWHPLEDYKKIS